MRSFLKSTLGLSFLATAILCLGSGQTVSAETIYRFEDEEGVIHFSNAPTDPRFKSIRTEGERSPFRFKSRKSLSRFQPLDEPGLIFTSRFKSRGFVTPTAWRETIAETSRLHQVDPALVWAVIKAESAFNPYAVSPKGAVGLMQLMPETALSLRVSNRYNPEQNIAGGVRYLRYLLDLFQGDVRLALAAYNAGEARVLRRNTIPENAETREYVKRVLRFYRDFRSDKRAGLEISGIKTASLKTSDLNPFPTR